jgi:cytochrome c-type biogenesis protein CcmH/NrfG
MNRCVIGLIMAGTLLVAACTRDEDAVLAKRIFQLEPGDYTAKAGGDKRIEEIKADVRKYKAIVEEKVKASHQLGTYYKMLAVAYMDNKMFGEALRALEDALAVHPESSGLLIYRGIAAAQMSKTTSEPVRREELLRLAEASYKRSIELDPQAGDAAYGLGVLYVFELGEPAKAIPVLEKLVQAQKKNWPAQFLLARARYQTGAVEAAAKVYDAIIAGSDQEAQRDEARKSRDLVLKGSF